MGSTPLQNGTKEEAAELRRAGVHTWEILDVYLDPFLDVLPSGRS